MTNTTMIVPHLIEICTPVFGYEVVGMMAYHKMVVLRKMHYTYRNAFE